jgi:hypothetical protein
MSNRLRWSWLAYFECREVFEGTELSLNDELATHFVQILDIVINQTKQLALPI